MSAIIYDTAQHSDRAFIAFVEDYLKRISECGEDNNAAADDLRDFVIEFRTGHYKFIRFSHWGEAVNVAEWHGWTLDNIGREKAIELIRVGATYEHGDPLAYFDPKDYEALESGAFEYLRNQGYLCWVAGEGLRYPGVH